MKKYKYFKLVGPECELFFSSYDKRDVVEEKKEQGGLIVQTWVSEPPCESVYGKPTPVKALKKGKIFKRKLDSTKAYEKGDYDRSSKKYDCEDLDDISRSVSLKGSTLVYPWPD